MAIHPAIVEVFTITNVNFTAELQEKSGDHQRHYDSSSGNMNVHQTVGVKRMGRPHWWGIEPLHGGVNDQDKDLEWNKGC